MEEIKPFLISPVFLACHIFLFIFEIGFLQSN